MLAAPEKKLDDSFPVGQFKIFGYVSLFRTDLNQFGGGIMVFLREDTPSKLLSIEELPIGEVCIELNLCKKKWLLCCSYNPNKKIIPKHLDFTRCSLDSYSANYDHLVIIEDFHIELNQECINSFVNRIIQKVS